MTIATSTTGLWQRVTHGAAIFFAKVAVQNHNQIQFLGYEVANVVLVVQVSRNAGYALVGLTFESTAALSLLVGSACIWRFDPACRPSMLYIGGMVLTLGGLLLVAAGYPITGLAVALASLETARGGMLMLQEHVASGLAAHQRIELRTRHMVTLASRTIGYYAKLVDRLVAPHERLGRFINDRPFLTGTLIKAPLRVEFIARKLLAADPIGAAVGLSWMLLGDGGLALNDPKLKASLNRFATR